VSEEPVRLRYDIAGAQEGATLVLSLADAQRMFGQATQEAGQHLNEFEQDQQRANDGHEQFAQAAQESTQQAIALGQRLQAAASAVQGIAAAFGADGDAAGLIARTTQSSVAFAQLGGTLGPGGALVGAIVGAAIPALTQLMNAEEAAAEAARAHEAAITGVVAAARAQQLEGRRSADVSAGTFGSDTSSEQLAAQRARETALVDERVEAERSTSSPYSRARLAEFIEAAQARIATIDEEIGRRQDLLVVEQESAEAARQRAIAADHEAELAAQADALNEQADGARRLEEQRIAAIEASEAASDAAEARRAQRVADAAAIAEEAFQQTIARAQLEQDARNHAHDEQMAHYAAIEETKARIDRQDQEAARVAATALTARQRLEAQNARQRERLQQQYLASIQDELQAVNSAGQAIGTAFSNAFQVAIQGQGDFGAALEDGLKQTLLQYGTQMVVEGAGALLTAAGLAILNPPAAGGKAIEGAGKIALGVGLGAAGAAINGSGAGGGAAPEAPRGAANGPASGGAITYVTNLNAPTVMGGTHAEVGRALSRQGEAGRRRYGGRLAA
jgi:hypothetical protein